MVHNALPHSQGPGEHSYPMASISDTGSRSWDKSLAGAGVRGKHRVPSGSSLAEYKLASGGEGPNHFQPKDLVVDNS